MNAALSVIEKAKEGWDGSKDFTQYMKEDFIPSMVKEEPKENKGPIGRYQSYFGGISNV
jgi:hypothetical protein